MADLDDLLSLEETFYAQGMAVGRPHGELHGLFEGRALGREKCWELWEEVGYYEGAAQLWKAVLAAQGKQESSDVEASATRLVDDLRSPLHQTPPSVYHDSVPLLHILALASQASSSPIVLISTADLLCSLVSDPKAAFTHLQQRLRPTSFLPVCKTLDFTLDGMWVPRTPPYNSTEDWTLGDERLDDELTNCLAPSTDPAANSARAIAVANWVWEPFSCTMRKWDSEAFVRTLLKMPHGLFLVGDSLAGQQKDSIRSLVGLGNTSILLSTRTKDAPGVWTAARGSASFFLNPSHPLFSTLISEGSFSRTRLSRPLVTRYSTYHLISNALLAQFINDAGGNSTNGRSAERWGSDPEWIPYVEAAIQAYNLSTSKQGAESEANTGSDEGEERTVVIVGSGVHWTPGKLEDASGLPAEVVVSAFQRTATLDRAQVDFVALRLNLIPFARERLRLIGRTIPPAMGSCVNFSEPLKPPHQVIPSTHINAATPLGPERASDAGRDGERPECDYAGRAVRTSCTALDLEIFDSVNKLDLLPYPALPLCHETGARLFIVARENVGQNSAVKSFVYWATFVVVQGDDDFSQPFFRDFHGFNIYESQVDDQSQAEYSPLEESQVVDDSLPRVKVEITEPPFADLVEDEEEKIDQLALTEEDDKVTEATLAEGTEVSDRGGSAESIKGEDVVDLAVPANVMESKIAITTPQTDSSEFICDDYPPTAIISLESAEPTQEIPLQAGSQFSDSFLASQWNGPRGSGFRYSQHQDVESEPKEPELEPEDFPLQAGSQFSESFLASQWNGPRGSGLRYSQHQDVESPAEDLGEDLDEKLEFVDKEKEFRVTQSEGMELNSNRLEVTMAKVKEVARIRTQQPRKKKATTAVAVPERHEVDLADIALIPMNQIPLERKLEMDAMRWDAAIVDEDAIEYLIQFTECWVDLFQLSYFCHEVKYLSDVKNEQTRFKVVWEATVQAKGAASKELVRKWGRAKKQKVQKK
ncbi:hypothetical protein P7C70_g961, partial [Phenoliferia sp. Uapishka_3]